MLDLIVGLSSAFWVPFNGALVRYRINYSPRRVELDAESGMEPPAGTTVNSFFGMIQRVYRLEGLSGLYKGLWPTIFFSLVLTTIVMQFKSNQPVNFSYRAPDISVGETAVYLFILAIVSIPSIILTNRSIATAQKLPMFNLLKGLRQLLSPTERRRPWRLYYSTPGLFVAQLTQIFIVVLGLGPLRRLLLPELSSPTTIPLVPLIIYLAVAALSTLILTPLEVIIARLSVQRNADDQDSPEMDETAEYFAVTEDVIELNDEEDPYLGLFDCARRIVNEEGIRVLYRAWWITLLGALASVAI
ncbi:hypothetical protein C8J56DRAFT_336610 [Mycena floridula]|nr:hypothetical protein C8J56DRAFT_336610 [Mycena floridula]